MRTYMKMMRIIFIRLKKYLDPYIVIKKFLI